MGVVAFCCFLDNIGYQRVTVLMDSPNRPIKTGVRQYSNVSSTGDLPSTTSFPCVKVNIFYLFRISG